MTKKELKELRARLIKLSKSMSIEVSKALTKNNKTSEDYKAIRKFEALSKFRTSVFFESI